MSSVRSHIRVSTRLAALATAAAVAVVMLLGAVAGDAHAAKARKSAKAKKRLPVVTRVNPMNVQIGKKLTISGKNIVKGKKKMRVIFQRVGSSRRFNARGDGRSSKSLSVIVPNVSSDLPGGAPAIFKIRLISRYGTSKSWTKASISPTISIPTGGVEGPVSEGPTGDCDKDGQINSVDIDDDNDMLLDTVETAIKTDPCMADTDGDGPTDYYEHRVAMEWNNGLADRLTTVPYPFLAVYPNPTLADADNNLDGDGLTMGQEFAAWQYTGRMDRFYSDADQDSDNDGIFDDMEDEDLDLLPNIVEINVFNTTFPLDWLNPDTDGDGLCDGLDDQDQDGPPTPVSAADCTTAVPNVALNGPGDPNPLLIDGDDNEYSNWYEWAYGPAGSWLNPCIPSIYPTSPSCPHP